MAAVVFSIRDLQVINCPTVLQNFRAKPRRAREYDAVLGGDNQAPIDGVVLGGIEGVKRRLANPEIKVRIAGLYQAFNYGDAGLELVIQALWDDEREVKKAAYSILKEREETQIIQKLEKYSKYQIFDCILTLEEHESRVNSICITPDGENLISGSNDKHIKWNLKTNQNKILEEHKYRVFAMTISYDGQTYFSYDDSYKIYIWNWQSTKVKGILEGKSYNMPCICLTPDNQIIFSSDTLPTRQDYIIKIWDWQKGCIKRILRGFTHPIFSLITNLDGNILFSGDGEYRIKIWDWHNQKLLGILNGHSYLVTALCIYPDGKTLFSGSGDYTIKIWDWNKGELIRTLEGHSLGVNSLVISPDGKTLISASNDTTIKVWNWRTGKLQATLTGHSAEVNSIVLSPDGKYLFSGSSDKTVKVWGLD